MYASTPDSVAASITSDIDLRVQVAMTDWTPGENKGFISKWGAGGSRSYRFWLDTTGKLNLSLSQDGTNTVAGAVSSVATGITDGSAKWVRATWVNSTNAVQFFTSDDGTAWTQLGTDQSISATGIFDSADVVGLGTLTSIAATPFLAGNLYKAEIRSGVGGTLVLSFDATAVTKIGTRNPSVVAAGGTAGGDWTITGSAWDWITV
jgi:hypothetical protein